MACVRMNANFNPNYNYKDQGELNVADNVETFSQYLMN